MLYSAKLAEAIDAKIVPSELSVRNILSELGRSGARLVDIQFEYRTFKSHIRTMIELPLLVALVRNRMAVVVTVHGVVTYQSLKGQILRLPKWLAFVVAVGITAKLSDRIVVHSQEMKRELATLGVTNVIVIPHGSGPLDYKPHQSSRESVLFFGFMRASKGIDVLIAAFSQVATARPRAVLTIAGGANSPSENLYVTKLKNLVKTFRLEPNVQFETRFISESDKEKLAAESEILVLPYTDCFVEVSGVAHDFSGYGMALICSQTPRFSELVSGENCIKTRVTPDDLAQSLILLMGDQKLREKLSSGLYRLAEVDSWQHVAEERMNLYTEILAGRASR